MSTVVSSASEIGIFLHNTRTIHKVVRLNADGITQQDSLVQPRPAGNCMNWVVGHLLSVYDAILPILGQEPVLGKESLARYARGSAPLRDPTEALEFEHLLSSWDTACDRVDAGLTSLTSTVLDASAPMSPSKNPNETVRSLLATVFFHQAYHAGQMGMLRRIAGKGGAIA